MGVRGGSWELMTSKMALFFNCVVIIDLIVILCFAVYVESFNCVHEAAFSGRI